MKQKFGLALCLAILVAASGSAKAAVVGAWRSNYKATTQVYVITFDEAVNCQYLKIDVTKLGTVASSDPGHTYVQLSEIEIINADGTNVATSATFALTNNWEPASQWRLSHINDGVVNSNGTTTGQDKTGCFTITLSASTYVKKVILYPRQDAQTSGGKVANFPASFTVQTSTDGSDYTSQLSITDLEPGIYSDERIYFPVVSDNDLEEDLVVQIKDNAASPRYVGYKNNINNETPIYGVAENSGRVVTFRMVNVGTSGSYKTFQLRGYGDAVYVARNFDSGKMLGWYNNSGGNGTYYLGCDFNDDATVYLYGDNTDGFTSNNHYIRWWHDSPDNDCGIEANQAQISAQKYYLLRQIGSIYGLDGTSSDVTTVISSYENTVQNFRLSGRTLSSSNWNTLCLPFALNAAQIAASLGDGCLIYECTSVEESDGTTSFDFTSASAIEAGKAYLVKPAADVENPVFANVIITATTPNTESGNAFVGIYAPTELSTDGTNCFLGAGNTLYRPAESKNGMSGFRAYFQLDSSSQARLSFENDGIVTKVVSLQDRSEANNAVGVVYSLSGCRVATISTFSRLPKGIYIINGRRFIK